jgi:hypothetical protein
MSETRWLTFKEAARSPMLLRPVGVTTVFRWHHEGILTPKGRVFLKARRVASRLLISEDALREFLDAVAGANDNGAA